MASFFSDFALIWFLEELSKNELIMFKEFLKQEILQMGLTQVSWTNLKNASREELANFLLNHYEEKQAWDVTFKIFYKLNRKDLIRRSKSEIHGHPKLYQAHLKTKLTQDSSIVFNFSIQVLLKEEFTQDILSSFEDFFLSNTTEMKPPTVVIEGMARIGKTLILKKLMLAWSEGLLFQNKFSYIFYFCCRDVKQLQIASLADLISREWPSASAPVAEILCQPKKLLFIIDSLEVMEYDMSEEQESNLCDNCMEQQPVSILMSSLLRRKMLPESSLLICTTPETFERMEVMIEETNVKTITGFTENSIKLCFHSVFEDTNGVEEAFRLVRENEQLFTVCRVPMLCGMVAACLKTVIMEERDPVFVCRRITYLYTTHIFNVFTPPNVPYPSKKSQDQLKALCSLAAEGMWTDTFVFGEEALRRNGIMDSDIPKLLDIGMLGKIRESENSYIFLHPSVQEVCAAIFYLLKSHEDHPCEDVKCIETLITMFLKNVKTQWIFLGSFIFGLANEFEQVSLTIFFGYQLCSEIKRQLYQCLETIKDNSELQKQIDGMKLFYCLFEMENEAFLRQAMNCMEQIYFVAKDYSDIIVAAYCLKHCSTLKKLSFSTQTVLEEEQEHSNMEKLLTYWNQICSVFINSKNIQEFQMEKSSFSGPAFSVLYDHLNYSRCTIKILRANDMSFLPTKHLFFDLIKMHSLQYLNLSFTRHSRTDVSLLCDILTQAECNIEMLELEGCDLLSDDCEDFACVLMRSKTLKTLDLAYNNLDQGIYSLCKALCRPGCVLKNLILAGCSLSDQCWEYLSYALQCSKTLGHLDISCNDLKDKGLEILCKALTLPHCVLETISMTSCLITSSGCQCLAQILRNNQNLKGLNVSENKLEDAGVKLLCDAIKHPNCNLVSLGLEACDITCASMEDLLSAFLESKTLCGVNLCRNAYEISELKLLNQRGLEQQKCAFHVLGLRFINLSKESQAFLVSERKKNFLCIRSSV
ncbi:LOW QUALITY PROTEIN: NACHT, LRR and PYD domains-containing protein 4A-like [Grammomys surdaster]|uniref:LOW QUALITY PROTEIN: NACHT, LRR and PYD domains-containing protein 4A-like n=1 Tax=Grammomys surdaster TaxID=491861 RepID=UPI00109FC1C2|nr:LOW QUALITY PROTEIN: NACHT, LRR and PYD domains-containing protein 4A-like [Grammomys surdaster]